MERRARKIGGIEIFEYTRPDGTVDHRVDVFGNLNGLDIKLGLTMDDVRDFFSKSQRKRLKAVRG